MILGITGSVGTGKSTVAAYFKALGAELINADTVAHSVIRTGTPGYRKIVSVFGKRVLSSSGAIDRKKLGKIVFEDSSLLDKLNNIVHPEVISVVKSRISRSRSKLVVFDAPLLIEAGLTNLVDALIVVKAGRQAQISRAAGKTGLGRAEVIARIKAQMPLSAKIKMADFVVDNNGTKIKTKKQVVSIWRQLTKGE
jgi:dephospho-CoA kinase